MKNLILTSAPKSFDLDGYTIISNAGYYIYGNKKSILRLVSSKITKQQIDHYSNNKFFAESLSSILEVQDFFPSESFINYLKDNGYGKYVKILDTRLYNENKSKAD